VVFELVIGFDRDVEEPREFLVRRRSAPLDNVRGNSVGGASEL
jgi:hypothetical protein